MFASNTAPIIFSSTVFDSNYAEEPGCAVFSFYSYS
jgi:hypothetical protein